MADVRSDRNAEGTSYIDEPTHDLSETVFSGLNPHRDEVNYEEPSEHVPDEPQIAEVSAFDEKVDRIVSHLANEEDRAKLKAFVLAQSDKDPVCGTEYYNFVAPVYGLMPDMILKGEWLKEIVDKHADWIGLRKGSESFKILDYCAGSGFLSHALAPYATKILAIDSAQGMVDAYNATAEKMKLGHPNCEMKAAEGDLSNTLGPPYLLENQFYNLTQDQYWDSDLVATCLGVDFFTQSDEDREGLITGLWGLIKCLKPNGTILIIDIERSEWSRDDHALIEGLKTFGNGSQDVVAALEGWGMVDVDVRHERFVTGTMAGTNNARDELYFLVIARKGEGCPERSLEESWDAEIGREEEPEL